MTMPLCLLYKYLSIPSVIISYLKLIFYNINLFLFKSLSIYFFKSELNVLNLSSNNNPINLPAHSNLLFP